MPELCIRYFGKRCEPTGMRHECGKLAGHKDPHVCHYCGFTLNVGEGAPA